METIADILVAAGSLGAGFYCFVLARRLTRFNDLEKGVGGAVAVLSAQVDDLGKALSQARSASGESSEVLADVTLRAESVAQRLELMMASLHDLPPGPSAHPARAPAARDPADAPPPEEAPAPRRRAEPMFMRHPSDRAGAAR